MDRHCLHAKFRLLSIFALVLAYSQAIVSAQSCPNLSSGNPAPVLAAGWEARLVATGLSTPRGIIFDGQGNLLVVEGGTGVTGLAFSDGGGTCLTLTSQTSVIKSTNLNHGITLSNDGTTVYASSVEAVYSWAYNSTSRTVGDVNWTLIKGMTNGDHVTRTLFMSTKHDNALLVSRGSNENVDLPAQDVNLGRAQIKLFNVSNPSYIQSNPYDYTANGTILGWGLRNSVGIAEHPFTGGIWSVENSADQVTRNNQDVHEDNPGEELNFHGYLNGSTEHQGGNYGYPDCFALWDTNIPDVGSLKTGDQFVMAPNSTLNDTTCATTRVSPRLTFQAHMAPLDIIFTPDGGTAYVSFHGSWDRSDPVGYKVSSIAWNVTSGEPVASSDSTNSLIDIMTNGDASKCPSSCFRPVGLAMDSKGRIFVSSDATGEIWVLAKTNSTSTGGTGTQTGTASPTPTGQSTGSKVVWPTIWLGLAAICCAYLI